MHSIGPLYDTAVTSAQQWIPTELVGTVATREERWFEMSFIFRKSKKVGPVRVTASKRGLSASTGLPGARVSAGTGGRRRASVGIPGSGARWQKTKTKRR